MQSSFHVCNPYCGKCRPPKEKPLICPACEAFNDPTLGEFGSCKACGALLPERQLPVPEHCLVVDKVCANPCGRSKKAFEYGKGSCVYHSECEQK